MISFLFGLYEKHRSRDRFWLLLIFISCFLVMLPMPLSGLPEGYDVPQHIYFAAAFRDAILAGDFFPGWPGMDNYGFGAVGIRFYPPLADYLMGITDIYFRSWFWSFIINACFWMFPGCVGMYLWAKEFVSREQAGMAGILFAVMPYHVLQIYQYTLFSEFVAVAILPFCFWAVTRVINRGRLSDILSLAVFFSLFILAHLPSIITGSLALSIYSLFLLDWRKIRETAPRLMLAGVLSLSATSFYWLRLVTEIKWVKHNTEENWSEFFEYSQYLFPIYFSSPAKLYWERIFWLLDITSLLTFIVFLPVIVLLWLAIRRGAVENDNKKFVLAISVTGLVLIFLMTVPAKMVWETIPILHKIQFPWRILSPTSVIAAMSFAVAVPLLYKIYPKLKRPIVYSVTTLLFGILLFNITENIAAMAPLPRETFDAKYAFMDRTEACECWWPVWGKREAFEQREKVIAGTRSVNIFSWEREERKFTVEGGLSDNARVATFWYPHWKAEVNGVAVEVGRDENGAILIPVGAERSEVRLYFQEPFFLEAAKYVSLATWIVLMLAIFAVLIRRKESTIKLASVA